MKRYHAVTSIVMGIALGILVLCPSITHADPLDQWHWRNPLPQGNDLLSVAQGNGEFVAVGRAGTILSSPDGATWTQRSSGTVKSLKAVTFGAGMFVAVGYSGTILTSTDGKTWSPQVSGVSVTLNSVSISNEGFAVAGNGGTILTSSDGVSWTIQATGSADDFNGIAFGNGVFVAIGSDGSGSGSNSYRSTDGMVWTTTNSGLPSLPGVVFGNGNFFAASSSGSILTSSDGLAWTFRVPANFISPINNISFSDGIFIAWAGFPILGSRIVTSPDGETWTMRTQDPPPGTPLNELSPFHVQGVTSAGGTLVAVGAFGMIMTLSEGVIWTQRNSDSSFSGASAMAVSFGSGTFVAVGSGGAISTSPDGMVWTPRLSRGSDFNYYGVTYGNGAFVAVGDEYGGSSPVRKGIISTSPDGASWTHMSLENAPSFRGVTYGNGLFVAVGPAGNYWSESAIFTSTDAASWTQTTSLPGSVLHGVHYANGVFVAVGLTLGAWDFWGPQETGLIVTSSDGVSWTQTSIRLILYGVTHGNGVFVAVGGGTGGGFPDYTIGPIMASPDGVTWYEVGLSAIEGGPIVLKGIAFGNDAFVAVGNTLNSWDPPEVTGVIVTSQNGTNWVRRTSRAAQSLSGAAFGGGTFVVVGGVRAILQSDNVLRPCEPGIAINSSKGIVSLSAMDTLSARINLKARSMSGIDADWWVVAGTPFGWYYYVYPDSWIYASDLTDVRPAHQGSLFDLSTIQVLQIAGLPMGAYAFYFGIDTEMNGQIDFDRLHLDSVSVNLSP